MEEDRVEEQEKKDEDVKSGSDKEIQRFPPFFVVFFSLKF